MNTRNWIILTVIAGGLLVLGRASFYVVNVYEYAIITQFGEVKKVADEPGPYFRLPFIQSVSFIDRRLREWDGEPGRQLTVDKEDIEVNTWGRWRITDPRAFYENLNRGSEQAGQGVLDTRIDSAVKDIISIQTLMEVLRNTQRNLKYTARELEEAGAEKKIQIKVGRENVVREILVNAANKLESDYGFTLEGVGIKHLNYARAVIPQIFERMRSERIRIANRYESQGREKEARILGEMSKELELIESEGYKSATTIRGKADAQVVAIYAQAYGQDPQFYSFSRTLEVYPKALGAKTRMILGSDQSDLLRYLKSFRLEK